MYQTEEEQIARLKDWWKQYGLAIVSGVLLGLVILFGWRYWKSYHLQRAHAASVLYDQYITALLTNASDSQSKLGKQILRDYPELPYADLAAMMLAKQAIAEKDYPAAEQNLNWVLDNSRDTVMKQLATVRLARVLLASGNSARALTLIKDALQTDTADYRVNLNEVMGDVLLQTGDQAKAKQAYEKALLEYPKEDEYRGVLQMKIDNLTLEKVVREGAS